MLKKIAFNLFFCHLPFPFVSAHGNPQNRLVTFIPVSTRALTTVQHLTHTFFAWCTLGFPSHTAHRLAATCLALLPRNVCLLILFNIPYYIRRYDKPQI